MNWWLFIAGAVVILVIMNIWHNKIDTDEKEDLEKPSTAVFLRNNYNDVINFLLQKKDYKILFENSNSVRIGNPTQNEYFVISNKMGWNGVEIRIVYMRKSNIIKEWKFTSKETSKQIINKL